jgi:hypothetical protein
LGFGICEPEHNKEQKVQERDATALKKEQMLGAKKLEIMNKKVIEIATFRNRIS